LFVGLPEAPCEVQVEPGPQDGTLLVTWMPVCLGEVSVVTGYAVYADGKKVTDVDSPTGLYFICSGLYRIHFICTCSI